LVGSREFRKLFQFLQLFSDREGGCAVGCERINENIRDICECTRAGMSLDQCNRRRVSWGIPPLERLPSDEVADPPAQKPLTTGERIVSFLGVSSQTVWRYVTMQPGLLTNEQMQPRLDICNACPELVDGHCRLCGCLCVKENRPAFLSKIAHPDSVCPHKPPKWGKMPS